MNVVSLPDLHGRSLYTAQRNIPFSTGACPSCGLAEVGHFATLETTLEKVMFFQTSYSLTVLLNTGGGV